MENIHNYILISQLKDNTPYNFKYTKELDDIFLYIKKQTYIEQSEETYYEMVNNFTCIKCGVRQHTSERFGKSSTCLYCTEKKRAENLLKLEITNFIVPIIKQKNIFTQKQIKEFTNPEWGEKKWESQVGIYLNKLCCKVVTDDNIMYKYYLIKIKNKAKTYNYEHIIAEEKKGNEFTLKTGIIKNSIIVCKNKDEYEVVIVGNSLLTSLGSKFRKNGELYKKTQTLGMLDIDYIKNNFKKQ